MSSENASDKRYNELIKDVEATIKKLQACDDVDDALELFEKASKCLQLCETKLEAAKGKFDKIVA